MDAEITSSLSSALSEKLPAAQEKVADPILRRRNVISKAELSEVIALTNGGVCALTHKADVSAPGPTVPVRTAKGRLLHVRPHVLGNSGAAGCGSFRGRDGLTLFVQKMTRAMRR